MMMGRVLAPPIALLAACGDATSGSSASAGTGATSLSTSSTSGTTGSGGSTDAVASTGGSEGVSSGATKLDLGIPDAGVVEMGCEKVDFLFVVDNSGSMYDHQQALIAAFPGFIAQIQGTLAAQDYHVMVVDSDAGETFGKCQMQCDIMGFPCTGFPCGVATSACDGALGGGVVAPYGDQASNVDCGFPLPQRFLSSDGGDLAPAFDCAGQVGISGAGDEKPMNAMLTALSPALVGPGGCNEGFLRDDAILVVTVLSDATITSSMEQMTDTPQQWHDALLAVKGGDPKAVAVLGLVSDSDLPDGLCKPNPIPWDMGSPLLRELVSLFGDHGVLASICEPDYQPFFAGAVDILDTTCDEFTPPR